MYAYLCHGDGDGDGAGHGPDPSSHATADPASRPGLFGSITFRQLAGPADVCLTLWDTHASAAAFAGRTSRLAALPADVYEVTAAREGPAAAQAPAYARLMYFDGPQAPEQAAAAERAGRDRIWPAIRGLNGLTDIYVLQAEDLGTVVITLATSIEVLDAAAHAAMSTELMPGEDPALLPGPSRIEIHHVTGYHMPAASPAAR